jgi:uncharacterized delta-60 repeat protein
MKIRTAVSLFCLALFILPMGVFAASGDLDRSYGNNGVAWAGDMDASAVLAIQPDNKIITGGQCYVPGQGAHFCLRRFTAAGALDINFGVQGKVFTPVNTPAGTESSMVKKVLVLPDGKIMAIGYTERVSSPQDFHYYQFAVVKYNSNGALDTTFDGDGIFADKVTVSQFGAKGYDAVLQPDGKLIVVGGGTLFSSHEDNVIARLNSNGSYDTGFSDDGKIQETWGEDGWNAAVALQPDGQILVAGRGGQFYLNVLARYTSSGTLDTTFANSGKVIYSGPGFSVNNLMKRITVLPDGKILTLSSTMDGAWPTTLVAKFNSNGSFDTTFDSDGLLATNFGPEQYCDASDLYVQPNGKTLIAANCTISSATFYGHAAISARILTNGTPDKQFANKGSLYRIQPGFNDSMVVQSDGKIVFGGVYSPSVNSNNFYLTRYLNNGTRENDFDNDRKADVSVFRPAAGTWYMNNSAAGFSAQQFGAAGDRVTPGDYDGDGKVDIAVYRNGDWYISRSSDNTVAGFNFGASGDVPVAADYDGDGKTDLAVFRQGAWYIINSANGSVRIDVFGQAGDKPVVGNFDGDLRSDLGIYRNGTWYMYSSTAGLTYASFGLGTDKPVAADYDGDGKTDLAVYRDGNWFIYGSFTGLAVYQFGISTDKPVPADYDGDGRADLAVYRNGDWYIQGSTDGIYGTTFGNSGDIPVPAAYLP